MKPTYIGFTAAGNNGAFLLILLIGISAPLLFPTVNENRGKHLAHKIPASVPGWHVRDEALGATPQLSQKAEVILQCDDFLYREFKSDNVSFSVYIAYWSSGKIARGLVGNHTPDICWISNGCTLLARKSEVTFDHPINPLAQTEWRSFAMPNGTKVEVIFWHVVGGSVLHFDSRNPVKWLRDAARELGTARAEQYFVRITSSHPFPLLQEQEGFSEVLRSINGIVPSQ